MPTEQRTRVRVAAWALLVLALTACASEPMRGPAAAAPYVGVFTGDFVDGMPLYRFPRIEVFGSRRGIHGDPGEPDGG